MANPSKTCSNNLVANPMTSPTTTLEARLAELELELGKRAATARARSLGPWVEAATVMRDPVSRVARALRFRVPLGYIEILEQSQPNMLAIVKAQFKVMAQAILEKL